MVKRTYTDRKTCTVKKANTQRGSKVILDSSGTWKTCTGKRICMAKNNMKV